MMERTVKGKDGGQGNAGCSDQRIWQDNSSICFKSGGEGKSFSCCYPCTVEIKATAAGIQLGMLFIDEPPFLDDEGAQAYVDALETIRDRYSDVKIMAITHDDAMKARFGQAVTVIKTDDGSKSNLLTGGKMADKKTYYYLKLKEGFFDSEDMLLLQGMKDGYIYR